MGVHLRKRELKSGKTQLYLEINQTVGDGTRRQRTEALGLLLMNDKASRIQDRETMDFAKKVLRNRQKEFDEQRHPGVKYEGGRKRSFTEFMEEFSKTRAALRTRRGYKQALAHFRAYCGDKTFGDLDRQLFEGLKSFMLNEEKLSLASAKVYLAHIKTALNQAIEDGIIESSPARFVSVKGQSKLRSYLTVDELRKLALTPSPREDVTTPFLLSCYTGLRVSDVRSLKWNQVTKTGLTVRQMKTGGILTVPLGASARAILEKMPKTDELVFPMMRDDASLLTRALKKWAEAAGVKKRMHFHVARHTFAMLLLSGGVDLFAVSGLLGHSNIGTTQIYAKLTPEAKRAAIDKLPTI